MVDHSREYRTPRLRHVGRNKEKGLDTSFLRRSSLLPFPGSPLPTHSPPPGLPAFLSRGIKPRRIYYQIEVPLVSPPFTFSIAQFTRAGIIKFSLL